ncbi:MAG: hypothetical protein WC179_09135 [Candidatus Cloacimonadaceae bacterium]
MKNENDMQQLLLTVNRIREAECPQISRELVEKILEIEKMYVDDRDKALPEIEKLINKELQKID